MLEKLVSPDKRLSRIGGTFNESPRTLTEKRPKLYIDYPFFLAVENISVEASSSMGASVNTWQCLLHRGAEPLVILDKLGRLV
jgi:hypothetical protein